MATDLARWQFAVTTLYHFIFVPITIGLSVVVAVMQTKWYTSGDDAWRRMTRFWGKLFLINFAIGVVTGIVQEFQFGMNWSSYSRYVGDIFGAPLAIEGLLAFFLESTFLGLWVFGWDRLPRGVHLATIWMVAIGTWLSALWILAANSWMQHPVGYTIDPQTGQAKLDDFFAVITNPTLIVTYPHTIMASLLIAGALLLGISMWHLRRRTDDEAFRPSAKIGVWLTMVSAVAVGLTGHWQAQIMTDQQPMKMAAAESLWDTKSGASFSVFAVGDVGTQSGKNSFNLSIPHALSVLATNSANGEVKGINDINRAYQQQYGAGDYRPNVAITYWSFRLMIGCAFAAGFIAFLGLLVLRRKEVPSVLYTRLALAGIALPLLGALLGWVFTEMGRQPWVVFGLLRTADAVSPTVAGWSVALTLFAFTAVYGVLAVIEGGLMARYARHGTAEDAEQHEAGLPAAMAY